ncbi:hypothetical protein WA026_002533 [Henosepilachna vigintioctopunctata]|uniref:Uncharacterized protein n=1 Tax=Henosepilachna vigintioctopunctata TaxID=420089 RepID=A0AAW1TRM9_9CUCU
MYIFIKKSSQEYDLQNVTEEIVASTESVNESADPNRDSQESFYYFSEENDSFENPLSEVSVSDLDYIIDEILTELRSNDIADSIIDINCEMSSDEEYINEMDHAEIDESSIKRKSSALYEEPEIELDDEFVLFLIESAKYQLEKMSSYEQG